jgi:hypothetical protein
MASFEGTSFTVDYPSEWQESAVDMLGLTMVFLTTQELGMEEMQSLDFNALVAQDPVVLIMVVPQEMATDMGVSDIDAAFDELGGGMTEEDAEIIEQGDTTIGGVPGQLVVARGTDPEVGEMGIRMVMATMDDGTVIVFMGATPAEDLEANLEIFEYMQETFTFK